MDAIFDRLIPDMAKPAHKRAFSANDLRNAWQRQRKVEQNIHKYFQTLSYFLQQNNWLPTIVSIRSK